MILNSTIVLKNTTFKVLPTKKSKHLSNFPDNLSQVLNFYNHKYLI